MGQLDRDYIVRAAKALGALVARLMGLKARRRFEEARREIGATGTALLGLDPAVFDAMDPPSAARLLADPRRVALLARLTEEQARVDDAEGLHDRAQAGLSRALQLLAEAVAVGCTDDDCREAVARLGAEVAPDSLPERCRTLLGAD